MTLLVTALACKERKDIESFCLEEKTKRSTQPASFDTRINFFSRFFIFEVNKHRLHLLVFSLLFFFEKKEESKRAIVIMPIDGNCKCGIGTCFGVEWSLHWTFWFNVLFQVLFAVIQHPRSWKYLLLIFTLWGPLTILIVIVHEIGHIWRSRAFGGGCTYSMLWPLGGFSNCYVTQGTCLQEFWVAFCGPLMHIPLIFIFLAIMALSARSGVAYYSREFTIEKLEEREAYYWFAQLFKRGIDVNIMIMVINLVLPAYPMDASRMVVSMCVHCGLTVEKAALVLVVIGSLFGLVCIIWGIISLVSGTGPGLFMLLIGAYVAYSSYTLYSHKQNDTLESHPLFEPDCYRNKSEKDRRRRGNSRSSTPTPGRQSQPYRINEPENNRTNKNKRDVESGRGRSSTPNRGRAGNKNKKGGRK